MTFDQPRTSLTADTSSQTKRSASSHRAGPHPPQPRTATPSMKPSSSHHSTAPSSSSTLALSTSTGPSSHKEGRRTSSAIPTTVREKKDRRRRQNNESSRRSRERKRIELESLQKTHVSNQLRITQLQTMVDYLSHELRKQEHKPTTSAYTRDERGGQDEKRPGWFGAAF